MDSHLSRFTFMLYRLILITCLFKNVQPLCPNNDRIALLQLKDGFTIDESASRDPLAYPTVASWTVETDCCSWDGVKCDRNSGHVISLNLNSSCLYGFINSSSQIFQLAHLERLNLADNNFSYSQLPSALGRLTKLTYVNLSSSYFTGQIPSEISNLSNLSSLDLSNLNISSQVPDFFTNFSSLTKLILKNCGLTGNFPSEIFQLPKLQFLSIQDNPNLVGHLPEFCSRSPLKQLWLSSTGFSGNIPSSIEKLDSLELLKISKSKFSGIPPSSLGKLTSLNYLDLSYNNFSGQIPYFLQNLTKLTTLWFGGNQLTGKIPPWIGNLTQLNILSFSRNRLYGPIPQSLSRLKNLRTLNLYENIFSGAVEFGMFDGMRNLAELALGNNILSVNTKRPNNTNSTSHKFEILGLTSCNLSEFPDFLRYQDRLRFLDLGRNNIYGPIPKWVLNASKHNIVYLAINDNFLTSVDQSPTVDRRESQQVSHLFCELSSLVLLELSNNMLSGILPQCLENPQNSLSILNIRNNSFDGIIPKICSNNGSNLRMIDLSYNQFKGVIPRSLANCMMLESINLGNNQLLDVFPSWLGNLPKLSLLTLRSNHLHGVIRDPTSISEFQSLRVIDLSCNNFNGKLPSEYLCNWHSMKVIDNGNSPTTYLKTQSSFEAVRRTWTVEYAYSTTITVKGLNLHYGRIQEVLVVIDFSSNMFEGQIPDCIGGLQGLRLLNLSNNVLQGRIPSSFGNMTRLESLDLSRNKLFGDIPTNLVDLTFLAFFNVSHNHLKGRIPRGNQFNTFENTSYVGNLDLCGDPLSEKCGDSGQPPTDANSSFEDQKKDWEYSLFNDFNWLTVVIGLGSGIFVGVMVEDTFMTKERVFWLAMKICLWKKSQTRRRRA